MKPLGILLILLIGMIAGLFLARMWPQPDTLQPVAEPARSSEKLSQTANSPTIPGTLQLRATAAGLDSSATATAIANNLVVAAIADFAGSRRLSVVTAEGQMTAVQGIVAVDPIHGLALLQTRNPLASLQTYRIEAGAGSLQLGRDLILQTPELRVQASVESAASQDELGAYFYSVAPPRGWTPVTAAIIDPASGDLLGLTLPTKSAAQQVAAVGNDTLNRLLARRGDDPVRSLSDFNNFYFQQTSRGRLIVLEQLVASEQYEAAIQYGLSIRHLDHYTQQQSTDLLETAFDQAVRKALQARDFNVAIALVNKAARELTLNDSLRLLRVEAYQATGQLESALDDLLQLSNPSTQQLRAEIIRKALASGQTSALSGIGMLEKAISADPRYAPYHRLLGETLAKQGDMQGALAALNQAISLDPTLQPELEPLLARLQARRNTPPLTEVPIQRQRSTLFVDVRINGSAETYRFLFDTGASYTAITSETALRLGINNIFFGAPVVQLETANGRVYTTTARLDSIDVSGARVDNVEAVILESMGGVDGLLGQSFLRHFDVNIDRTRGVIIFNRRLGD